LACQGAIALVSTLGTAMAAVMVLFRLNLVLVVV
jgi:hypothetical protein